MSENNSLESNFKYSNIQDLGEEGTYRRYDILVHRKSNKHNSILIKQVYDIFKNNGLFDGYSVYKIVMNFNGYPRMVIPPLELCFEKSTFLKYSSFFEEIIECIDRTGLFLEMMIVWCYPNKQHARKNLTSWKKEVLKDAVCVCCGGDKHLEAHHIFSYITHEDLRDDPNNGIALCKWCHKKYHSYYPEDANPKDLIEFMKRFGGKE